MYSLRGPVAGRRPNKVKVSARGTSATAIANPPTHCPAVVILNKESCLLRIRRIRRIVQDSKSLASLANALLLARWVAGDRVGDSFRRLNSWLTIKLIPSEHATMPWTALAADRHASGQLRMFRMSGQENRMNAQG